MPDYTAALRPHLDLIIQAAVRYGLDPRLLGGLVQYESGGNPTIRSKAGAVGLGQVMPRERGFPGRPTTKELEDPATNLDWSARILSEGIKRWGTVQQGLAAYLGTIDAKGQITGADPYTGVSGNQYVQQVLRAAEHVGERLLRATAPTASAAGEERTAMDTQLEEVIRGFAADMGYDPDAAVAALTPNAAQLAAAPNRSTAILAALETWGGKDTGVQGPAVSATPATGATVPPPEAQGAAWTFQPPPAGTQGPPVPTAPGGAGGNEPLVPDAVKEKQRRAAQLKPQVDRLRAVAGQVGPDGKPTAAAEEARFDLKDLGKEYDQLLNDIYRMTNKAPEGYTIWKKERGNDGNYYNVPYVADATGKFYRDLSQTALPAEDLGSKSTKEIRTVTGVGVVEIDTATGTHRVLVEEGTHNATPPARTADQARLDAANATLKELEVAAAQHEANRQKELQEVYTLWDQHAITAAEANKRITRINLINATATERAALQVQREAATGLQHEFDVSTGDFQPKAAPRTPVPGQDQIDNGDTTATTVYSDGSTETWDITTGQGVKSTPATKPEYLPTAAEETRRRQAKAEEERLGLEKGRAAREETAQQREAVAAAEKATGYRHQWNAKTGQVEFALDKNGQRQQTAEREQKERQNLATNTQNLAGWEQQRQSTLASAAGNFAQYGVATAGPLRNLNALATSLPKEVVLAALGLQEGDQRGEAIYNVYAQMAGGKLAPGAAQGALGAAAAAPGGIPGGPPSRTGAPAPVNGAAAPGSGAPPGGLRPASPSAPPSFTAPSGSQYTGRAEAIGAAGGPVTPVSQQPALGSVPFVAPATAPAPKQPVPGRDAVDLGPEGRPGWARTYYTDGSYEDWEIPPATGLAA